MQYLYEGQQHLGEIRDGKISHRLLTGLSLDETIARLAITGAGNKEAAGSRLYLTDALNSAIAQLNDDAQATLANSYAYSPFGESQVIGVDSTANPVQYTSRENDGTGLIYYRARYRSPVGQWLSEDPAGFVDGPNLYEYANNDPISQNDPTGKFGLVGAIDGAGIDLAIQMLYQGKSLGCVDIGSVLTSAAFGALTPGWVSILSRARKAAPAVRALQSQLPRAGTTARAAKIKNKIAAHVDPIALDAEIQILLTIPNVLIKQSIKDKPWRYSNECECEN